MSDKPDVSWRFECVTPIGRDPTRGFVVDLATVADDKVRGGRGIDPEEAALVAQHFRVKGFEKVVSPVIRVRAPESVSTPSAVLDLLVEHAEERRKIPS
jgi:hypothetical protein